MVSEINSTKQSDLTSYFFMVSEINSTEQSDLTSYFFMVSEINSTKQSDLTSYFFMGLTRCILGIGLVFYLVPGHYFNPGNHKELAS
jgi:hypothetical protein